MERLDWCIETYGVQAKLYFDYNFAPFDDVLRKFLEEVPVGGSRDKALKSQISGIKFYIRQLVKWDERFNIMAPSFHSEVKYIFALENNPIAAIWRCGWYGRLDSESEEEEEEEYPETCNHKERDGHVYAVRGNWALKKGFMKAGPAGYLDEISRPQQELSCDCYLTWLFALRDLPTDMVTELGRSELVRVAAVMAAMQKESPAPKPGAAIETESTWSRLARWFGRR